MLTCQFPPDHRLGLFDLSIKLHLDPQPIVHSSHNLLPDRKKLDQGDDDLLFWYGCLGLDGELGCRNDFSVRDGCLGITADNLLRSLGRADGAEQKTSGHEERRKAEGCFHAQKHTTMFGG